MEMKAFCFSDSCVRKHLIKTSKEYRDCCELYKINPKAHRSRMTAITNNLLFGDGAPIEDAVYRKDHMCKFCGWALCWRET